MARHGRQDTAFSEHAGSRAPGCPASIDCNSFLGEPWQRGPFRSHRLPTAEGSYPLRLLPRRAQAPSPPATAYCRGTTPRNRCRAVAISPGNAGSPLCMWNGPRVFAGRARVATPSVTPLFYSAPARHAQGRSRCHLIALLPHHKTEGL